LIEYQMKCHDILFNHFHGSLTERKEMLIEKAALLTKRHIIETNLKTNDEYIELCKIKGREMLLGKSLKENDEKLINSQLTLSFLS
jgi:hypothetical protein